MAYVGARLVGVTGAGPAGGVPVALLPKDDKNTFLVRIHLAETTPLAACPRFSRMRARAAADSGGSPAYFRKVQ
jgi:hypothetical protein